MRRVITLFYVRTGSYAVLKYMSRQIPCVNTSLHTFQKQEHLLPAEVRKLEEDIVSQHM